MSVTIPKRLEVVRVTEVSKFKECRRAWYLSEIRGLVPKAPQDYLWFGDKMHIGLQTLAATGDVEQAVTAFFEAADASIPDLRKGYGGMWEVMEPEFQELVTTGKAMLHNYALFDRQTGMNLTTTSLEERLFVPIRTASGRSALKGMPQLSGRMDRLVVVQGKNGEFIQDYKNSTHQWTEGRGLELDEQTTGYHFLFWRIRGYLPEGMIYDTLIKRIPIEPKILKNGTISKDKDQGTTYELMLEAVKAKGADQTEYAEILSMLREQGWSKFFKREVTHRNLAQMRAYETNLYDTFQDMRAVAQNPRKAYPNPSPMRCPRCPFRTVCLAMNDGSDYEDLIKAQFTVSEEKRL
jgi:CRISPR/Cas system-associated exonuclease Cas4 (RecB family)